MCIRRTLECTFKNVVKRYVEKKDFNETWQYVVNNLATLKGRWRHVFTVFLEDRSTLFQPGRGGADHAHPPFRRGSTIFWNVVTALGPGVSEQ